MDIEQLKLILETIGAAGEGARDLAYVWFGLQFLRALLDPAVVIVLILTAYHLIKMVVHNVTFLSQLGRHLSVDAFEPAGRRVIFDAVRAGFGGQR